MALSAAVFGHQDQELYLLKESPRPALVEGGCLRPGILVLLRPRKVG
jgi:hypothetical protein